MQQNEDLQHLKLLSTFHYVHAGLTALVSCFPLIHFTVGISMLIAGLQARETGPFLLGGLMFAVLGGSIVLLGWVLAVCIALAGRALARQKRYTFCLVLAGIQCAFTPIGTVLGIFTIIVLMRPSVKALFQPVDSEIQPQPA